MESVNKGKRECAYVSRRTRSSGKLAGLADPAAFEIIVQTSTTDVKSAQALFSHQELRAVGHVGMINLKRTSTRDSYCTALWLAEDNSLS